MADPPDGAAGGAAGGAAVARRFEAVVFDWDGTAVPDRQADAHALRAVVEELSALGMHLAVVSGTHLGNVDPQLRARPPGPGELWLALNRGSELYRVGPDGPVLLERREATPAEDAALTDAAERTVAALARRGLAAEIVSSRLNRRKIDLIPLPEWSDPPKAVIDRLLDAVLTRLQRAGIDGLEEVVALAAAEAAAAGLHEARVTSDAKHVEIGLTDKSDSARVLFARLAACGVGPGLVLLAGDEMGPLGGLPGSDALLCVPEAVGATVVSVGVEPGGVPAGVYHLGGGPDRFVALLADQRDRRRRGEPPAADPDPRWSLPVDGLDVERERATEALLTLADGRVGSTGAPLLAHPATTPWVLAAGVYDGEGPDTALLPGPVWWRLVGPLPHGARLRRHLDLRAGLLTERVEGSGIDLRSARFSSLAEPGTVVVRVAGQAPPAPTDLFLAPPDGRPVARGEVGAVRWMRVSGRPGGIVAAGTVAPSATTGPAGTDRIAHLAAAPDGVPEVAAVVAAAGAARAAGFERLLDAHRRAWGARWETGGARIDGDDRVDLGVRLGLFHLIASVADRDEAAVGARGLTGPGYRGHVFWDADTYVLPYLAATHPAAARAMLEYRLRRLPAARAEAARRGCAGARFPWESAHTGDDVTPPYARDRTGRIIPIRTGAMEEHITAQVAWAAHTYLAWTGDEAFAAGPGRELLVETARYWASRIRLDPDGAGHLYGVIGPDEYHEPVDDNAFTNIMARWNLRRAAALDGIDERERRRWLDLADALVDGYDPRTGLYEQFAGFYRLEPLVVEEMVPRRPIAADLVLGAARVAGAQVVKQADVLLAHHLVPEETAPGSLRPNLEFYEPRTAHGSSLSPGIHAALFARAGDLDRAEAALRTAALLDLDDLTMTTAAGVHLATAGSVWQALAFGFAGVRPRDGALTVDPRLPERWRVLELRVRFRGVGVRLEASAHEAQVHLDGRVTLEVGGERCSAGPGTVRLVRRGGRRGGGTADPSTGRSADRHRGAWEVVR